KNTNSSLHISGDKKILQTAEAPWFRDTRIFLAIVTALAVFSSSGRFFSYKLELSPSWASLAGLSPVFAALIIYPFINFRQSQKGTSPNEPSVRRFGGAFQKINILEILPIVLSGILGLWFLVTLFLPGNPSPLPFYIPILNPIDLLEGLCITVILFWQIKSQKENDTGKKKIIMSRTALFVLGDILTFLWIISILARSLHFFAGIRWDEVASSGGFQLCLFVFWALYGILHIVLGHKKKKRIPWIAGAILVAIDIIKLILFDMRDINTVPRILSFFAAGLVLLFIGWAAPLPPPHLSTKEKVNEEK
ncbi:MAG: DUF2339 domain-containing protein, partial [Treponema sp.]|nr:DUF2339 domain-containing protein [Treponema sp.]